MLRMLLFFYSDSKDMQRLIWMCQFLLKNENTVQKLQTSHHQIWLHQIKCLLLICSRSLETSIRDPKLVDIQLRMLEVFTPHNSYSNPNDPARSGKDAAMVMAYLVRNGYLRHLDVLLNATVPSNLEPSTVPPTSMATIKDLVMNSLYFSSQSSSGEESALTANDRENNPLLDVCHGIDLSTQEANAVSQLLSLLSSLLSGGRSSFITFSDTEMKQMFSVLCAVVIGIIKIINPDDSPAAVKSVGAKSALMRKDKFFPKEEWIKLLEDASCLVQQLYSRNSTGQYCPVDHWLSVNIDPAQMRIDGFLNEGTVEVLEPWLSISTARNMAILRYIPFVVPFPDRVELFQRIVAKSRLDSQGEPHNFTMRPAIDVTVNRNYIYQHAFDQLNEDTAPNLRQKLCVRMINAQGMEEAGVDRGGISREFLNQVLKTGCDPNIGFFKETPEGLLYPNPVAATLERNFQKHYHFIGRMLGKALLENMLVDLPFASFFLCKLLSKHGTDVDIHHLKSLDPEVYRHLLFLQNYRGNFEELLLDFTVVDNDLGESQVVELKPGGRNIPVTNDNRISYIQLRAHYRLNKQIESHCAAFRAGLSDVIKMEWLQMFDHKELQDLIAGSPAPVDLEDLKRNTNYLGGFTESHPSIRSFWRVVEQFTDKQKRLLLEFVTSSPCVPVLGFKELEPSFSVCSVGPEDRLPSASTCMNLLKLPEYLDDETMKEKLLYAVESDAGFELS